MPAIKFSSVAAIGGGALDASRAKVARSDVRAAQRSSADGFPSALAGIIPALIPR
jgi:hypothetical protein